MTATIRPVRFTLDDANNCGWQFNCGPGALCAILNLTPAELRPMMGDFEKKGYTNPTLMYEVLHRSGKKYRQTYRSDEPLGMPNVEHGLIRIQWGGPWTKPGVPMKARYRQTHWVAARNASKEIFDINGIFPPQENVPSRVGGWLPFTIWHNGLMPWLAKECVPKWDGTFWPTHAIEVEP